MKSFANPLVIGVAAFGASARAQYQYSNGTVTTGGQNSYQSSGPVYSGGGGSGPVYSSGSGPVYSSAAPPPQSSTTTCIVTNGQTITITIPCPSTTATYVPPPTSVPPVGQTCPYAFVASCAYLCPNGAGGVNVCSATGGYGCTACPGAPATSTPPPATSPPPPAPTNAVCPAASAFTASCAYLCPTGTGGALVCAAASGYGCTACPVPVQSSNPPPPVTTTPPPPVTTPPPATSPPPPAPTNAVCPAASAFTASCAYLCPTGAGGALVCAAASGYGCTACPVPVQSSNPPPPATSTTPPPPPTNAVCPAASAFVASCAYLCPTGASGSLVCAASSGAGCTPCPTPVVTSNPPPPTTLSTSPAPPPVTTHPVTPNASCPAASAFVASCAYLCPTGANGALVCSASSSGYGCTACPRPTTTSPIAPPPSQTGAASTLKVGGSAFFALVAFLFAF
ncbi:hypothetical protein TWF694_008039 [Orbilia ellipsospora]|uniref:Uncharacterized protein n=1 Tax=Orbilia ellipsospora TaxID=2528407 RepID=A0AAV9XHK7_9PEZI